MRVSTSLLQRQALDSIVDRQRAVEESRERVSSGRRLLSASEDPAGSERLARLSRGIAELEQLGANGDRVGERLELAEATLANVTNTLQRIRELGIRAGNPAFADSDRDSIVIEMESALDALIDLANTRDADGQAIFAGTRSDVVPWVRSASGVIYGGDDAVRQVRVGPEARVADGFSGLEVFDAAPAGNGTFVTRSDPANLGSGLVDRGTVTGDFQADDYRIEIVAGSDGPDFRVLDGTGDVVTTGPFIEGGSIEFNGARVVISGTPEVGDAFTVATAPRISMFEAVQALADAIDQPATSGAERILRADAQASALTDLDAVLGRILDVRADIGARFGTLEVQQDLGERLVFTAQRSASEIRDVDLAEAITELEARATSLEAAQRAFARIQGLSLFRFLN